MPFITKLGSVAARAYGWIATIVSAATSDAYFYLVSMLLPGNGTNGAQNNTFLDSSTNNFTVTRNGNTTQGTFTPFSQTGWSNYFDGVGDYLSLTGVSLASTNFTIEGWVQFTSFATTSPHLYSFGADANNRYAVYRSSASGKFVFGVVVGGVFTLSESVTSPVAGTWYHVAVVSNSSVRTLYINGVAEATNTAAISAGTNWAIGFVQFGGLANDYLTGYISNFRVVKGTALYVNNFVPPASPLTAIANTSLLTCQSNRLVDNSVNNFTLTRNGDVSVQAFSPFAPNNFTTASYSGWFDGNGDSLSYTGGSSLNFGTADFTVEAWLYLTNTSTFSAFLRPDDNGAFPEWGYDFSTGVLKFDARNGIISNISVSIPTQQWIHLSVSRAGTSLRQFINGVQVGTTATNTTNFGSTTGLIRVGGSGFSATHSVLGFISNFRVVKGTALYTANFTPPTVPLTAIANTSLLTCQNATFIDNSTNAFAITVNGNTQPITTNPFTTPVPNPISYSGYFDGNVDGLQIAYNSTFILNTNFTIESWIFPSTSTQGCIIGMIDSGGLANWDLYFLAANTVRIRWINTSTTVYSVTSAAISLNTWTHVAATLSGLTLTLYINGVSAGATTVSGTARSLSNPVGIGRAGSYAGDYFTGFISNARIVNGTALYTANFIPSNVPLTAVSGTSLLTCQNDRFIDNSTNAFAITANGDAVTKPTNPYGYQTPISSTAYSGYFDGTGDYLNYTSNSTINFGTSDFTVECWIYLANTTGSKVIVGGGATNAFGFRYGTAFNVANGLSIYREASADLDYTSYSFTANTWYHVAVVRQSGVIKYFVNGAQQTTSGSGAGAYNFPSETAVYIARGAAGAEQYAGFISNLRVVKGTAVYTAAFTPPTTPLTAISGTSLLTCQNIVFADNSSNAFAVTVNGNAVTTPVNPFGYSAPLAPTPVSYSALINGGSGYFDGTGDYLTVPNNTALNLSSGDFTIDGWFYCTALTAGTQQIINKDGVFNASYPSYAVAINTSGNLILNLGNGAGISPAVTTYTGSVIALNTWTHFACVKTGTTIKVFQNGVQTVSTSQGLAIIDGGKALYVGSYNTAASGESFVGYISNPRVVKGTAVYTSAFAPPTAPGTAIANTSLLLDYTNAGILDAASQNDLETVGNAQISTAQSKWGGGSIAFDGTGDWLLIPHQSTQFLGTGNFTIEMWVYRNSSGTYGLVGKGTATTGWLVSLNSSNQVVFTYGSSTITSTGTVSATTWTHIAVVRAGTGASQTKIYISGTNDGTGTVSTDFNQTNSMYVGADRTGGSALNGYIDDLRITKYARYTANFTPPTAAFPTQ